MATRPRGCFRAYSPGGLIDGAAAVSLTDIAGNQFTTNNSATVGEYRIATDNGPYLPPDAANTRIAEVAFTQPAVQGLIRWGMAITNADGTKGLALEYQFFFGLNLVTLYDISDGAFELLSNVDIVPNGVPFAMGVQPDGTPLVWFDDVLQILGVEYDNFFIGENLKLLATSLQTSAGQATGIRQWVINTNGADYIGTYSAGFNPSDWCARSL